MEWNNEEALALIQEYKKHTLLWNSKDKFHFNKIKKNDAWEEIGKSCQVDSVEAKKKMASLLGSFRREKAKVKKTMGTGRGAAEIYKTNWFAFKSLLFLEDKNKPRANVNAENNFNDNSDPVELLLNSFRHSPIDREESFATSPAVTEYSQNDNSEEETTTERLEIPQQQIQNNKDTTERQQNDYMETSERLENPQSLSKINRIANGLVNSRTPRKNNNFTKPRTPKCCRKAVEIEDPRVGEVLSMLRHQEDPDVIYAQHLANKLSQFKGKTKTLVERAINQVIFEAEMGKYDVATPHFVAQTPKQHCFPPSTYPSHCSPLSASSSTESQNSPMSTHEADHT